MKWRNYNNRLEYIPFIWILWFWQQSLLSRLWRTDKSKGEIQEFWEITIQTGKSDDKKPYLSSSNEWDKNIHWNAIVIAIFFTWTVIPKNNFCSFTLISVEFFQMKNSFHIFFVNKNLLMDFNCCANRQISSSKWMNWSKQNAEILQFPANKQNNNFVHVRVCVCVREREKRKELKD